MFMKFNQNTLYLINNKLININILKSLSHHAVLKIYLVDNFLIKRASSNLEALPMSVTKFPATVIPALFFDLKLCLGLDYFE